MAIPSEFPKQATAVSMVVTGELMWRKIRFGSVSIIVKEYCWLSATMGVIVPSTESSSERHILSAKFIPEKVSV